MVKLTAAALSEYSGGRFFGNEAEKNKIIKGITFDSREVRDGFAFACIKGQRTDGHAYIADAAKKGAVIFICERVPDEEVNYILVDSTVRALQNIAENMLKAADIPVVGISGSVGKTSTKEMIASVLSQKYNVLKTKGNHNNALGLPLTVFDLEDYHNCAVLEMGVSMPDEMPVLAAISRPDICVLTNIADCHLENLVDRAGVCAEKSRMFDFMKETGHICLNGDDDVLRDICDCRGKTPVFFGFGENCSVRAVKVTETGISGSDAVFSVNGDQFEVRIPAPGRHMISNALAAAAVGNLLGLSNEQIRAGILEYEKVSGRQSIIETKEYTLIDDCYNANPMSMEAALELLSQAEGRRVAVLGDMGELGRNEVQLHKNIGTFAAEKGIEVILCAGSLSEHIAEGAEEAGAAEVHWFPNRDELASNIKKYIKKGDTIIVKASHFMQFETIVSLLKEQTAD